MHLPKRAPKFEWNLNTVLQLFSLAAMLGGGVFFWVNRSRDVDDLLKASTSQSVDIQAQDKRLDNVEAQLSNHEYRITIGERFSASTEASIKEVQTSINQQSGDLKVVREILQRIEAAQKEGQVR